MQPSPDLLQPMMVEETYEVLEAIDNQDYNHLSEELGDVLLHIVFQAQMGKEESHFDIDTVIEGICTKLIRRHPHVFAGENGGTADDAEELGSDQSRGSPEKAAKTPTLLRSGNPCSMESPASCPLSTKPIRFPHALREWALTGRISKASLKSFMKKSTSCVKPFPKRIRPILKTRWETCCSCSSISRGS